MIFIRKLNQNEIQDFQKFEQQCVKQPFCVAEFIEVYGYTVYIAEVDGEWAGYLVVHELDFGVWDIIHIIVLKQYRLNRIATKLMEFFQSETYIRTISLEVDETNEKARCFYEKNGFNIVAMRKNYYEKRNGVLMNKQMKYILAIETSCDETAAAVVRSDFQVLSNIIHTQKIHEQYGGVVPEVASREHVEKLPVVIEQAMKDAGLEYNQLDYIAVTYGPGLAGSLMIGVEAAKTLGWQLNIPVIPINHMAGHIYANKTVQAFQFPLLAVTISGGHTEIVEMLEDENFSIISQTHDDAIGEVYDKVARILGLGYPGGPKIAALAEKGQLEHEFPIATVKEDPYGMSFSGLKTAVMNYVHNKEQKNEPINIENIAYSFQHAVIQTLDEKLKLCLHNKTYKHILLSGGVSANTAIQAHLREIAEKNGMEFSVPEKLLCTDNAAMIGLAACTKLAGNMGDISDNMGKIHIKPGLVLQ
ncbi:MAG: tRNA (adenosine(37)-N6)-threonylcarbamoyltransferase complex transferase subunit TsaD [Culicoidibacterales bacterium]